jgi:hypothetical protein
MKGDKPTLLQDEKELVKQSIEIIPASPQIGSLARSSRIRFGKALPIHHNVKAKELGRIKEEHVPLLISYWRLEMGMDHNTYPMNAATPQYGGTPMRVGNLYVFPKSPNIFEAHSWRCEIYRFIASGSSNPSEDYPTVNGYKGYEHTSQRNTQDMETDSMDTNTRVASCFGYYTNRSAEAPIDQQIQGSKLTRRDVFRSSELEYVMITEVGARLHSGTQD